MDIRSKAVAATAKLHLKDADEHLMYDGDKPVCVNLFGPGSKQYARAQSEQQNRAIDKLKRKGKSDTTPEQRASENAHFLADCTESFENLDYDGKTGRDLAVAVYSDTTIGFIADQVAAFIGDWSNFTKASATN